LILIVSIADVKDLLETHAASFQKENRKMATTDRSPAMLSKPSAHVKVNKTAQPF
jgi:hypothetical protein